MDYAKTAAGCHDDDSDVIDSTTTTVFPMSVLGSPIAHDDVVSGIHDVIGAVDDANDDSVDESVAVRRAIRSLERAVVRYRRQLNRTFQRDDKSPEAQRRHGNGAFSTASTGALARPSGHGMASVMRADKVKVFMRVVFLKIGEIDTLKENFTADAFIQARWREPDLDIKAGEEPSENVNWAKYWNPKLYIANNLGEPKESVWQTMSHNARGEATVCERRRIKGCFLENLELGEFPFDTQDLTLTITTERSECELDLAEDLVEISSINVQSFVDEQEWKLHSHVETWNPSALPSKVYQTSKHKHPSFSASCRASRRPGFFIWNIFLVMLFICSLTFSTFSVDLVLPQNRLQLAFILLLTTISFKFVVCQTLPQISYLTYLDKYILTSMAILCSVCVWHAIASIFPNFYGIDTARNIDRWGLVACGSAYFLFHVCFFMYIYLVALHKRWMYNKKDKEHRERIKRLQQDVTSSPQYAESDEENTTKAAAVPSIQITGPPADIDDTQEAPIANLDFV